MQGLNIHYKSNAYNEAAQYNLMFVGYSCSQIRKELKLEFITRSVFMQEICNQL